MLSNIGHTHLTHTVYQLRLSACKIFSVYNRLAKDTLYQKALDRIVNLCSDDSGDESDTSSDEANNVIDSSDSNSDDEESARPPPCKRQTMTTESASTEGKDKTIWHHLSGH